jgi:hypothetical protein
VAWGQADLKKGDVLNLYYSEILFFVQGGFRDVTRWQGGPEKTAR